MKHEIDIEGLPEGYEVERIIIEPSHEYLLSKRGEVILRKTQRRQIVLEETEEVRKAKHGEYYWYEGLHCHNVHGETTGKYVIWREVKEGE